MQQTQSEHLKTKIAPIESTLGELKRKRSEAATALDRAKAANEIAAIDLSSGKIKPADCLKVADDMTLAGAAVSGLDATIKKNQSELDSLYQHLRKIEIEELRAARDARVAEYRGKLSARADKFNELIRSALLELAEFNAIVRQLGNELELRDHGAGTLFGEMTRKMVDNRSSLVVANELTASKHWQDPAPAYRRAGMFAELPLLEKR